jgi:hypothetical protein
MCQEMQPNSRCRPVVKQENGRDAVLTTSMNKALGIHVRPTLVFSSVKLMNTVQEDLNLFNGLAISYFFQYCTAVSSNVNLSCSLPEWQH